MKQAMLAASLSAFVSLPVMASEAPLPDEADSGVVPFSSSQLGETIVINNRAFDVKPAAAAFSARATDLPVVRKGVFLKERSTGQWAEVTGRFAVLLNPGESPDDLVTQYNLEGYQQMGTSRMYLFDAKASSDLVELELLLQQAKGVNAVKIELLNQMMQPF